MELTFDSQLERKANLQTICDPTWEQIEEAIRRLDGKVHTEVLLSKAGQLSIGGGAGQYFVSIFTDDERSLIAIDQSKTAQEHTALVSGGQTVSLPKRQIVDVDAALRAARAYFETERPDPTLTWDTA